MLIWFGVGREVEDDLESNEVSHQLQIPPGTDALVNVQFQVKMNMGGVF
jgi:hypothetical protein